MTVGLVTLTCAAPPASIQFLLGEAMPDYSGGYGGWETVERPKRRPLLSWQKIPQRELVLDLVLDGYASGTSVEPSIAALERCATGSTNSAPPEVQVAGQGIPGTALRWAISDLTWQGVEVNHVGERIRAKLQLKLVELVDEELFQTNPAKGRKPSRGRRYRVKKGDTLTKIAARKLGSAKRWREIAKLNATAKHPRRVPSDVVVGELLRLP